MNRFFDLFEEIVFCVCQIKVIYVSQTHSVEPAKPTGFFMRNTRIFVFSAFAVANAYFWIIVYSYFRVLTDIVGASSDGEGNPPMEMGSVARIWPTNLLPKIIGTVVRVVRVLPLDEDQHSVTFSI